MGKKERRKKQPFDVSETVGTIEKERDDVQKDKAERNNSRSGSRGRRYLSSLFKTSRPESEERGREKYDYETIEPKVDPRGYLQRMTVREAIEYNRQRGRSPDRRVIKLERKLLNSEYNLSADDRSTSLPFLADELTVQESEMPDLKLVSVVSKGGSTLPRVKKRRQRLDTKNDIRHIIKGMPDTSTLHLEDISSNTLPRDKIDHDKVLNNEHDSLENIKHSSRLTTSKDKSPSISSEMKKPVDTSSNVREEICNTFVKQESSVPPSYMSTAPSHREGRTSQGSMSTTSSKASQDVSRRSERSSYVSPRRFSRLSRSTSNKSDVTDTIYSENNTKPVKPQPHYYAHKYRRHFSRESRSRKSSKDETNDTRLNMEVSDTTRVLVDACTNTDLHIDTDILTATKMMVDEETSTQPDLKTYDFSATFDIKPELDESKFLDQESKDTDVSKQYLQKDQVSSKESEAYIESHDINYSFKPIKMESEIPAEESDINENSIEDEPLSETIETNMDTLMKMGLGLDVAFGLRDIQDDGKRNDEAKKVKSDKLVSKSKITGVVKDKHEKRAPSDRKRKGKKGSKTKIKSVNDKKENIPRDTGAAKVDDKTVHENDKTPKGKRKSKKSRKEITRKVKDKQQLSVSDAVKSITRTASLSTILDKAEYATAGLYGKRSKSVDTLDSIRREPKAKCDLQKKEKSTQHEAKRSQREPKLSLAAIVALKAKISRMRKARDSKSVGKPSTENKDAASEKDYKTVSKDLDSDVYDDTDLGLAKIFYENEINTNLGKSENDIEIIGDDDQEVKLLYEKRIQFSPYCEDGYSEEEMIRHRQRNTRLTDRRESKVRQRQKKVINCCKKFVAFLFSHIGLCSLVVAYCIAGGLIFKSLEGEHEIEQKKEIQALRENFTEKIHRLAFETTLTKGSREIFKGEVREILKNFSIIIHKQTKEAGWDGKEVQYKEVENGEEVVAADAEPEQWSYPSSLLYAITVMTTIGYGHVAPKTDEGRIMTIAYAVLGIPLTLLCLTNIGDVMAHGFRMLYGKVCCGLCCILFRPRRRRRLDPEKGLTAGEERILLQENQKSEEIIHVPTSVCLLLMSSYIMIGTFLFAEWENWDMVTGTYFCFITLSTIGFGDVVPGMSRTDWDQNEKLVSCALYLLFGLSLIAMCFNLVQEDVKAKCRWLGMKLGIIDKPVSSV